MLSFELFSDNALEFLILFDEVDLTMIQRQNEDLRTKCSNTPIKSSQMHLDKEWGGDKNAPIMPS